MAINFPASPTDNQIHTENDKSWKYDATNTVWNSVPTYVAPYSGFGPVITQVGGTETTVGDYKVVTFNGSGYLDVVALGTSGTYGARLEYLVVAGGGGGGSYCGGGAGGKKGGAPTDFVTLVPNRRYKVVVGAGGAGGNGSAAGTRGSESWLDDIITIGGGFGGQTGGMSSLGGSGAGAAVNGNLPLNGHQGIAGQGNVGGNNTTNSGGGGGGSGGTGGNGTSGTGGNAGVGSSSSISGSAVTYAAGGAGHGATTAGATSAPGGAAGVNGGNATANRGSGGGACSTGTAGAGSSGIVIVRYKFQ